MYFSYVSISTTQSTLPSNQAGNYHFVQSHLVAILLVALMENYSAALELIGMPSSVICSVFIQIKDKLIELTFLSESDECIMYSSHNMRFPYKLIILPLSDKTDFVGIELLNSLFLFGNSIRGHKAAAIDEKIGNIISAQNRSG